MSNIPQGYKPFNYEEAIKDISKVRTRDGRSVTELHKFNALVKYPVQYVLQDNNNEAYSCTLNGVFDLMWSYTNYDLFLIDDSKIVIQIPEDTSIHDFAYEVAKVIVNDYGMHNQNPSI